MLTQLHLSPSLSLSLSLMAFLYEVKVFELCRVSPPPNLVPKTSIPLTFFDLVWLRQPPSQQLVFYEYPHPTTHFQESLLPKIKSSLSLTLQHFYPLAGNITWPPESTLPVLRYLDTDSVCLIIAESNANFQDLSGNHARDVNESHPLIPHLPISDTLAPVLALQVTIFPNTGFSIGVTTHHAVADGKTVILFIKAWAFVCRSGGDSPFLPESLLPFYDRTVIQDPAGLEEIYLNKLLKPNGFENESENRSLQVCDLKAPPKTVRATFQLSRDDVERLRKRVLNRYDKDEQTPPPPVLHISTFTLTCAYVMKCLVKAEGGGSNKIVNIVIPIDCRARLSPPIPETYFGNCVRGCFLSISGRSDAMGEDGLADIAEAIGEAIRRLENGILKGVEEAPVISRALSDRLIGIAGSPRLGFYDTDFGWGRPKKVEIISIDRTEAISFVESRDGDGGVEVGLALKKHLMDVFASMFADGLRAL